MTRTKTVQISDEARAVLSRSSIEPMYVILPSGKLDKALYAEIDKFLKALGGKWNRSQQGHFFPGGTAEVAAAVTAGAAVDQKKTLEQFFTPDEVVERVLSLVHIGDGTHVLEPSAGAGALARAAIEHGANVTAIEIDSKLMPQLELADDGRFGWLRAINADFLTWLPPGRDETLNGVIFSAEFDVVLMNPPFGYGADMAHVIRALSFLRPGGTLVAIMSPHWTFAGGSKTAAFSGAIAEHSHDWHPLPEGSFRSAGTDVNTGILVIRKGQSA